METAEFSTTPIVPVLKPNGQVRICGDFKVSVNQYLDLTKYPLPYIEEVFERLSGGQIFFKLDQPDAYFQVELDDESRRHVVITTHLCLYRYDLLCFELSSARAIFQGIIEQIQRPVKGVQPYLYDIALKGTNLDDQLRVLIHVFQTLRQAGVKLKREKCVRLTFDQVPRTSSAAMAFDPTPVKSEQSSRLRPQQIENNSKVSSGWYSTTVVIYQTSAHSPVL